MKIPKAEKRGDSWRVRLMVNGEKVSITDATEKGAIAKAMQIKAGKEEIKKKPLSITLADAYRMHIESKRNTISVSTLAGYTRLSHNTFQDLMDCKLENITNDKIQRSINKMAKAKSPKYIANANGLLFSVLRHYHKDFIMDVCLPTKERKTQRAVSKAEMQDIIAAVKGTDVELPVLMAMWMGMRMSEIRGAKYDDIKDGRLHICRAIVDDIDGKPVTKSPKTFSGDRTVTIPDYIRKLMTGKSGYIVTMSAQAIYKRFVRICEKNGIEHCSFHALRHTNAAVMIACGVDSKYAQERNGWKSDYMYKQVYGYTMNDKMREVDNAIDNYFENLI